MAFRLHLPSEIVYHNAGPGNPKRGNILVWEQPLADRLRGEPLVPGPNPSLDARMKSQSILYRTLWLFGATFVVVAVMFVLVIWWILRQGNRRREREREHRSDERLETTINHTNG